ncbi:unnamed protein product, partial [Mesorhabditis belari]|uniref:Uncharacterized protein n=1 Tax=Mesorhabditis belari TaxID=2138241 RepID=A0AAF3J1M5_9BILA
MGGTSSTLWSPSLVSSLREPPLLHISVKMHSRLSFLVLALFLLMLNFESTEALDQFGEEPISYVKKGRPQGPLRFGKRKGPSGPLRFGKRSDGLLLSDGLGWGYLME